MCQLLHLQGAGGVNLICLNLTNGQPEAMAPKPRPTHGVQRGLCAACYNQKTKKNMRIFDLVCSIFTFCEHVGFEWKTPAYI